MALFETTISPSSPALEVEAEVDRVAQEERDACLVEVRKNTGKTAEEIAKVTGLDVSDQSCRLAELREVGLVKTGRPRVCSVTGRPTIPWFPGEEVRS